MSECQTGGCQQWVHVFDQHLSVDYCCCIDADWQRADDGSIVCGRCGCPIYRDESPKEELDDGT